MKLPDLPVMQCVSALRDALSAGHAVLSAEPGSGKTTLVPLLLINESWLGGRKILMLEPRRPAARMAARRMSELLGQALGSTVGYQVRFERKISAATRVEVLTEGLLLRRLQADPELSDVGLIIFDEFHERNLQGDLSLALALDVAQGLRDDLRLLVMSASLQIGPLLSMLPATEVNAQGRTYPVSIEQANGDPDPRNPIPACLQALERAIAATSDDVLVFLPGRREIERMSEAVRERWGNTHEVARLFGDLPAKDQDKVLRRGRGAKRRVILSTDIAETSLTIEGVGAVVDSGLARRPVFDPATGLTRLLTRWISKASALQRAGRAGRLGPGHCFRAWSEARHARLDDWTTAEILQADLCPLVLELANWGLNASTALCWLDTPPTASWRQAATLLRQLGALDDSGRITPAGKLMSRIPAHPRLAHMLAGATTPVDQALVADIAALLSERDPLRRQSRIPVGADVGLRLDALAAWRQKTSKNGGIDQPAMRRIDQIARQFLPLCSDPEPQRASTPSPGLSLAMAYPDRVALCTSGDGRRYLMRNGRAALLDENDPLRGQRFLAVADVDAGAREGRVWLAAPLDQHEFDRLFAAEMTRVREIRWDAGRKDVVARAVVRLGALTLKDEAVPLRPGDPVIAVLLEQLADQGLARFFADPVELRARVCLIRAAEPASDWPDFSESTLLASTDEWLLPWLNEGQGVAQLRALKLEDTLIQTLGWDRMRYLDRMLPTHYETPAGTRRKISYTDQQPSLAVPLQEMLGEATGPLLAEGRVPLLLQLLSPAGRPLQLTQDLSAFWSGAYDEVRKEMRGRYPKHYWPDDPLKAKATRFTKRRMQKEE